MDDIADLGDARQRQQIRVLEEAAEDRWLLQRVREVYDHEQELYGPTDD